MKSPCMNCERKGCGTYHDECTAYQQFLGEVEKLRLKRKENTEKFEIFKQSRIRHRKKRSNEHGPFRRKGETE